MISKFFIDRPTFAMVISIIITLVGFLAMQQLPISQYPDITPPQIQVAAIYPGADAETVAQAVAAPIEQQVNGVENMIYMYSNNSSSGAMSLNIFFDIGTDVNQAQIDVQNRVTLAEPQLPDEVRRQGVQVQKRSNSFLMIISLQSPDGRYDNLFTSNYASLNILDELKRIPGASEVVVLGARDYAMRVWLRPDRLAQYKLTVADVARAIQEQNAQFAVGQIGQFPTDKPVELTFSVTTRGRFTDPQEFEDIILRAGSIGSTIRLKDVARVELGARSYDFMGTLNGKPTTMIGIFQQADANALEVAQNVRDTMERLSKNFPAGIVYSIPYDTVRFVEVSIQEVIITFLEALTLVALVVMIFLKNWRAAVIPMLAVPVSIIGTFAGMYLLGFSINTLTLFGMVLAIGIVVDDAIVVVENVERHLMEHMTAREAAYLAMREVTGPVIAIVLVLCAVFIPVGFLGGIAGQLYQQFAITIAISVVISGVVALTLSPALAALLLSKEHQSSLPILDKFEHFFDVVRARYVRGVEWVLANPRPSLLGFLAMLALSGLLFWVIPRSFVPPEDQGVVVIGAALPDAASISRTTQVSEKIEAIVNTHPKFQDIVSLTGFSFLEGQFKSNVGSYFAILKPWDERPDKADHVEQVIGGWMPALFSIPEANVYAFNMPPIPGLGSTDGFEMWIQHRGEGGIAVLEETVQKFIAKAQERKELIGLTTFLQAFSPQLYVELDRNKAKALGVPIDEVFATLQSLFGSLYVNDFNKFGRVYQVQIQAEPKYRSKPEDIGQVFMRSQSGKMIPLSALATVKYTTGPSGINRFNGFVATRLFGSAAPGYSSGQAMNALLEVAQEVLPPEMRIEWSGQSFQEQRTGGASLSVFGYGLLMVFLILAAQYGRWSLPLGVILVVPFAIFGALVAVWLRGMNNDVYFQIGLVTLVALAAKNAILLIEFAVLRNREGVPFLQAAVEAARLRFRPIVMTSMAFMLGVLPLALSQGAGAAARQSMGTGVLGGMLGATALALFFVPLFYWIIEKMANRDRPDSIKHMSEAPEGGDRL